MSRPARTQHGDYGYARRYKCTCEPCLTSVRKYSKRRRYDAARGVEVRIDGDVIREHLNDLLDQGAHRCQISSAAGISDTVTRHILVGATGREPARFVLRPTAAKLLSLTLERVLQENAVVSNVGIVRRIEALNYMGHSKAVIARQIGVSETQIYLYLKREHCFSKTIGPVHAAYVALRDTEGDSVYLMSRARRNGWLPPMCWDDETIDDPQAKPHPARCIVEACSARATKASLCRNHYDLVSVRGGLRQPRRYADIVRSLSGAQHASKRGTRADVLDLAALGWSADATARHLGISTEWVQRLLKKEAS